MLKEQQDRILTLFQDNYILMSTISTLKLERNNVRSDYDALTKLVILLSPGNDSL